MTEHVQTGDTVRFGAVVHNPSGGALIDADETPRWYVFEEASDTHIEDGLFTKRSGLTGTYRGSITPSGGWIYDADSYYEIQASGKVNGIVGRAIVKTFVLDDIFHADVKKVSGVPVGLDTDLYYADIHYVKDAANAQDEYTVVWFKNAAIQPSSAISNPAFSVLSTATQSKVISDQTLDFIGIDGVLRHTSTPLTASGEPYIVVTSGTIDNGNRVWEKAVGISLID